LWVWALKCSLMDLFLGLVKVTCAPFPSFAFSNSEFLLSLSFGATSSIAESTYHFQVCHVNSVPGLMIHIGLQLLLGHDEEVIGDVIWVCQHHMCCC